MINTRYDAVIFDLFGTLVAPLSLPALKQSLDRMSEILGVEPADFSIAWSRDAWPLRLRGAFRTLHETLLYVCQQVHTFPTPEQLQHATEIRYEYCRHTLIPLDDTLSTLTTLKRAGYKLALISDCTIEISELWKSTAMSALIDVAIFSCVVGLSKPDPRIYLKTCEQLDVEPRRVLYVGDGGSQELTGACAVGMESVLIQTQPEEMREPYRQRQEVHRWRGPCITTLHHLLPLVDCEK